MQLNVKTKTIIKRLENFNKTGEFLKYPDMFKRNSCIVKVNNDDYLQEDEFIIRSSSFNLPRQIYLYGKNGTSEDVICFNQWMEIFLNTIEKGYISKNEFKKSDLKYELAIGISYDFRNKAFRRTTWTRENIIDFLSCLFDTKLEEICYQQQDMLEMMVA